MRYLRNQIAHLRLVGQNRPILAHVLIWLLIVTLLAPALTPNDFWWTDESRHAMGGVFVLDLLRDLPLADPFDYAFQYFAQYPALALTWYLPGFYTIEALFFAAFGVSAAVAHLTVIAFCLFAASLWILWVRRTWGLVVASLSATLFLTMPAWKLWTESVMLDVPAISMIIASVWAFERYLEKPSYIRATMAGLMIAGMLLVKQPTVFILPALLIYGLWGQRRSGLWSIKALPAYALVTIGLSIIVLHAMTFGHLGLRGGDMSIELGLNPSRFALERWLVFPEAILREWGWPLVVLSILGAVLPTKRAEIQLPLIYAWLLCWYIAITLMIGQGNAARYTLYAFPALALLAARPLFLLSEQALLRQSFLALVLIIAATNGIRAFFEPPRSVTGYREAADYVYAAEPTGLILFAGKHDGNFIFNLRILDRDREHVVLRADKTLVSMAVHKFFGVYSHVDRKEDIQKLIDQYGVEIIVIEKPDIVGLEEFEMLHGLLEGSAYQLLSAFPVLATGDATAPDKIEVYRYTHYAPTSGATVVIPLPHLGREIRMHTSRAR